MAPMMSMRTLLVAVVVVALLGGVQAALEETTTRALATDAETSRVGFLAALKGAAKGASKGGGGGGGDFSPCKTCVFVIERIKKGTNMLLPSICAELYEKFPKGGAYASCHETLNALQTNGNNVRYWLFEGCYKYEIYQAKEWVKPCPSHVMCSVLKDLSGTKPFCEPLPMENPFTGGGGKSGGGGAKKGGGLLSRI
eukprot:CAMPEP_0183332684 /NCGR_PEP_ID=MMETSP0164_2-20130417/1786_1 /TAXON_ID=221442 /ORGANISM="Coccolithus pelagicus ssp braarudi, Strain PLY182g" /LENGTH=196 /DNA_ID=CAMNT_0025501453 /DNA_START=21 /DNA_END=611 /DNA_ORIENTATION=-